MRKRSSTPREHRTRREWGWSRRRPPTVRPPSRAAQKGRGGRRAPSAHRDTTTRPRASPARPAGYNPPMSDIAEAINEAVERSRDGDADGGDGGGGRAGSARGPSRMSLNSQVALSRRGGRHLRRALQRQGRQHRAGHAAGPGERGRRMGVLPGQGNEAEHRRSGPGRRAPSAAIIAGNLTDRGARPARPQDRRIRRADSPLRGREGGDQAHRRGLPEGVRPPERCTTTSSTWRRRRSPSPSPCWASPPSPRSAVCFYLALALRGIRRASSAWQASWVCPSIPISWLAFWGERVRSRPFPSALDCGHVRPTAEPARPGAPRSGHPRTNAGCP